MLTIALAGDLAKCIINVNAVILGCFETLVTLRSPQFH
jgi:hypothetical protein